jgi:hypothetical protein
VFKNGIIGGKGPTNDRKRLAGSVLFPAIYEECRKRSLREKNGTKIAANLGLGYFCPFFNGSE